MNVACVIRISDDKTCEVSDTSEEEIDPEPCDSVLLVDSRYSATSTKSSVVKRIKLQKKTCSTQARGQKFALGGSGGGAPSCWKPMGPKPPAARGWGFGGKAPSGRRHGGLGADHLALENFAFFCKNNFILEPF